MSSESSSKDKSKELMKDFDDLLKSINGSGAKEKILWRQIYNNAISDRENANLCFMDVYPYIMNDMDNHITIGNQAVQYMTRMEKANEQLLKLAGLIQKALENEEEDFIDEDELMNEIQREQDNIIKD